MCFAKPKFKVRSDDTYVDIVVCNPSDHLPDMLLWLEWEVQTTFYSGKLMCLYSYRNGREPPLSVDQLLEHRMTPLLIQQTHLLPTKCNIVHLFCCVFQAVEYKISVNLYIKVINF